MKDEFWSKLRSQPSGCWHWTAGRNYYGYGWLRWDGRMRLAHRVAWTLALGPIPAGLCVLHRCDNPPCCNPDHLFLGTRTDNNRDMIAKGRHAVGDRNGSRTHPERVPRGDRNGLRLHPERCVRGERHSRAKLTESQVREIRALAGAGTAHATIASHYGIGESAVGKIISGRLWRHVA